MLLGESTGMLAQCDQDSELGPRQSTVSATRCDTRRAAMFSRCGMDLITVKPSGRAAPGACSIPQDIPTEVRVCSCYRTNWRASEPIWLR